MIDRLKPVIRACFIMLPLVAGQAAATSPVGPVIPTPKFVHPGIPLTIDDLKNVREMIKQGREPWYSGYQALAQDHHSSLSYKMQGPAEEVDRNLNGWHQDVNLNQWRHDMRAIGNQARMWYYTGDPRYAQSAHDMLLKWATTQKVFGGYEAVLDMGDYIHHFLTGADILRGTWPGWTSSDTATVKEFFKRVYYPATGILANQNQVGPANKGTYGLLDAVYLTLFNDDKDGYEIAMRDLMQASQSGMLNTLPTGQIGETLRDQGHPYDEWYSLARIAEANWSQGVDIYTTLSDRLLAVGEYHARLGLYGNTRFNAQWIPYGTTDSYYLHVNDAPPYAATGIRAAVNMLRGAYKTRLGMLTPWMDQALQYAPEDQDSFSFEKVSDTTKATPISYTYPSVKSVSMGLSNADIGNAADAPGSSRYTSGRWELTGAGSTIFVDLKSNPQTHVDNFHFAYLSIEGDGTLIAKVNAPPVGGSHGAVAGIAVRDSLVGVPAVSGAIGLSPVQGDGVYAQTITHGWTSMRGGPNWQSHYYNDKCVNRCTLLPSSAISDGYWVKIDRLGHWLNFSVSPDGTSWATIESGYFDHFPAQMYYGLLVSSGVDGSRISATFSHVAATGGDGLGVIQAPAAPLNTVTGISTNRAIVRWLPSAGATTYNVKRSMSSQGPYTTIASGVTGTSYIDQGLVKHGTYYYTVSASNAAGESRNSPSDMVSY